MTQTTEQILALADIMNLSQCYPDREHFARAVEKAAIESYKAELLNGVGEPVSYMTTDEEGSASMLFFDRAEALKYSGDDEPVNLFTESQLLSAVSKGRLWPSKGAQNARKLCEMENEIESLRSELTTLTRQRDLAVEAMKMAVEMIETNAHERRHVRWKLNDALSTIKESEVKE